MTAPSAADYEATTLEASESFVNYYAWLFDRVGWAIGGRTLEFGAGAGTLSARLRPLASELVLVEPAPNLGLLLAERFAGDAAVTVCRGTLDEAIDGHPGLFGPGFDTVASFNVLEHIHDDVGVLRRVAGVLRPGGRVVLFVPAMPSLYGTIDAQVDHVRRYTKATLRAAIEDAGLQLQELTAFDLLGMVPWFITGRVLRRTTAGGGVKTYDRFVVPVCRAVDKVLGPPVGKNLVAIATLPG